LFEVAFIAGGGRDEEFRTALAPLYEGDDEFSLNKLMDFKTLATITNLAATADMVAMIVCFSLGITGAISYNYRLLFVAVIANFRDLFSFGANNVIVMIWNALCICFHASLIMEIQSGIMSPLGGGVEGEIVEPIGFFRAFATQSNMRGRLCRETWYGHHSPCLRILLFVLCLSFTRTLQVLLDIQALDVPILKAMSDVELQELRDVHSSCLRSFCEVARDILPIDCIVGRDGHSAYMYHEAYNHPRIVPLSHSCRLATQKTVGMDPTIDLIHIRKGTEFSQSNLTETAIYETIFHIDPETCTVEMKGIPHNPFKVFSMLLDAPEPGQRQQNLFERRACLDEWSDSGREAFSSAHAVYAWILTYRLTVYYAVAFASLLINHLYALGWLMIRLIPSTFVLRLMLRWPKDFLGYHQVTFWSIWRNLVLIYIVTSRPNLGGYAPAVHSRIFLILPLSMILGAYHFRDMKALREWGCLYLLWITQSSWTSDLTDLLNKLAVSDGLNLVPALGHLVNLVIPGKGWWRLVRLYAFCMSYSALWKKMDDPLPPVQEAQQNGGEDRHPRYNFKTE
jgi:hypothetical protein